MLRVGILTSGGDCQGLNAAIRGVARCLFEHVEETEIIGYLDGYKGLITGNYLNLKKEDFSGILTLGGTMLGTSRMPFKAIDTPADPNSDYEESRLQAMIRNYKMQKLDCLVILGGNGTHKTANALRLAGLNIITLPKTIDNDLYGTDITFGFQSAVNIATDVLDKIHSTATSHGRVFIVEVMGHSVGWLTLYAGISAGADIILIPEIPYNLDYVVAELNRRAADAKRFTIIAMAEGAKSVEEAQMSKKAYKKYWEELGYPSVAYKLEDELRGRIAQEVRIAVPGHVQRGGTPAPFDRVYASRCGTYAAQCIMLGRFGIMVGMRNNRMVSVPLEEVAGKLKYVDLEGGEVKTARDLGICFGDLPEHPQKIDTPDFVVEKLRQDLHEKNSSKTKKDKKNKKDKKEKK